MAARLASMVGPGLKAAAVVALATAAILTSCADAPRPAAARQSADASQPADAPSADARQEAVVVSIADGDTLRLRGIGPGPLPAGVVARVRVLEIDSPEEDDCGYREATARLAGLIPPGSTVRVDRDRELADKFGRYLLYLWTEDGRFVNVSMVDQGFARAVLFRPNDEHIDRMRAAESAARGARRGLWATCGSAG
ncbi:MAG TPA: thermonuclease family protein [Mycobacteriales bacterium]|nr:thermonuclease family protein [Mycobacteriales bacterium]